MSNSRRYRVYRIPESLRRAVKAKREAHNITTKAVLDGAVSESLPQVVEALRAVKFRMTKGPNCPIRWAVDAELLGALQVASRQCDGIPASKLLMASLILFCQKGVK